MSNKCSHLGLSLQGKTALLQAGIKNGCVTCNAHGSTFNMADGAVVGTWCEKLPGFLRQPGPKPLPVYEARVADGGMIEVNV